MKIKRIVTISVFVLFLVSVTVFMAFGPQIRAALSPEIRYTYPVVQDAGGQLLNSVPALAVWQGEDGRTYIWKVSRSDTFPEPAFVVNACPVQIELEQDGTVFIGYAFGGLSSSDAVAVDWSGTLKEGMCVRPGR
ncbi:MAG: hypothetical protein IKX20_02740 [Paludibacteraceae bacterium]|nr:hypothetical protein [Paludibacteraceae bacterium]